MNNTTNTAMAETTETETYSIESTGKLSNRQYHAYGKPVWWARIGSGPSAIFVEIGRVRGDSILAVDVEVAPGTVIVIGVGPADGGIRETITCE